MVQPEDVESLNFTQGNSLKATGVKHPVWSGVMLKQHLTDGGKKSVCRCPASEDPPEWAQTCGFQR